MPQSTDPKDPTAPQASPLPPAAAADAPEREQDELSDEELGNVNGGMASIPGARRSSIKSDVM